MAAITTELDSTVIGFVGVPKGVRLTPDPTNGPESVSFDWNVGVELGRALSTIDGFFVQPGPSSSSRWWYEFPPDTPLNAAPTSPARVSRWVRGVLLACALGAATTSGVTEIVNSPATRPSEPAVAVAKSPQSRSPIASSPPASPQPPIPELVPPIAELAGVAFEILGILEEGRSRRRHGTRRHSLQDRCAAVEAVLAGQSVAGVAQDFDVSPTSIYRWKRKYLQGAEPSLNAAMIASTATIDRALVTESIHMVLGGSNVLEVAQQLGVADTQLAGWVGEYHIGGRTGLNQPASSQASL